MSKEKTATRKRKLIPSTSLLPGRILEKNESFPDRDKRKILTPLIKQEEFETDVEDNASESPPINPSQSTCSLNQKILQSQSSPVPEGSFNTTNIKHEISENEQDSSNLIKKRSLKNPEELQKLGSDVVKNIDKKIKSPPFNSSQSTCSLNQKILQSQSSPVPEGSFNTTNIKHEISENNQDSSNLIQKRTLENPEELQKLGNGLVNNMDKKIKSPPINPSQSTCSLNKNILQSQSSPVSEGSFNTTIIKHEVSENKQDSSNLLEKKTLKNPEEIQKLGSDLINNMDKKITKPVQIKTLHCPKNNSNSEQSNDKKLISEKSMELSKFLNLNLNFKLETISECLDTLDPYLSLSQVPLPQYFNIIPKSLNTFASYKKLENNTSTKTSELPTEILSKQFLSKILETTNSLTSVQEKRKINHADNFPLVKKIKNDVTCFESKISVPQSDFKYFCSETNLGNNISKHENTKMLLNVPKVPVPNTTNVVSKCTSQVPKLAGSTKGTLPMSKSKLLFSGNSHQDVSTKFVSLENTLGPVSNNIYLKDPRLNRNLNSKTKTVPILNVTENPNAAAAVKKLQMHMSRNQTNLSQHNASGHYCDQKDHSESSSATVRVTATPRNEEKTQLHLVSKNGSDLSGHNVNGANVSEDLSIAASARNKEKAQLKTSGMPFSPLQNNVIKWKTEWLNLTYSETPPILLPTMIKEVKNSYESAEDYAKTYKGLHLLSVWLDIQKSVRSNAKLFPCKFHSVKKKNVNYKNCFKLTVANKDMPVQQCVILVAYTKENGSLHTLFGFIERVEIRETSVKETCDKNKIFDVLLTVISHEKIEIPLNGDINIKKLCVIRVAIRQYEALIRGTSDMKTVACQPDRNTDQFRVVHLPNITPFSFNKLGSHLDTIINHVLSPKVLMTVVCKPCVPDDSMLIILRLINKILLLNVPILICLSSEEKLFKIAKTMNDMDSSFTMIAVKEKELNVPEDLRDYTLRGKAAKMDQKETENLSILEIEKRVIEKSKIILTMLSHVFLGVAKKLPSKTVCLIKDAHLISEADTALAMEMLPQSLLFFGAKEESRELDLPLQIRNYNKTLFHRLLECETP